MPTIPSFSPKELLKPWKVSQLSRLLVNLGIKSTGRKDELLERIDDIITKTRTQLEKGAGLQKQRVLSVDMGIKNLAICAADVRFPSISRGQKRVVDMNVMNWQRIDLINDGLSKRDSADDPYSPSNLSKTAYSLITNTFLPLKPTHILIERQRFRTSGAPAIQEWTVRVNMLESMIWAILRSLREQSKSPIYDIESMSPARIAKFWVPDEKKVEKSVKVALVDKWLKGQYGPEGVALTIKDGIRDVFEKGKKSEKGKRDDLADSLLQAVAWAAWNGHRRAVAAMDELQMERLLDYQE
jgi:cruciform cutting endonuclease 1